MTDLELYQEAVRLSGDPETFKFYDKGDYIVGNYISIVARFPSIREEGLSAEEIQRRILLRDLRGILFDTTGKIISRPLHKFHNLNEGLDHQYETFDWEAGYDVFDKLDGSMVRPFLLNGDIRWGTKAGITHMTPDIEEFAAKNKNVALFAEFLVVQNLTGIFEFMAPQHRIVVDYGSEPIMTLLAIRSNDTGAYMPRADMEELCRDFNINIVKQWQVTNHDDLLAQVSDLQGAEGVIIKFPDGRWVKVKSLHYLNLHKSRECIERERYVIAMSVREQIDDMLPLLPDYLREKVSDYSRRYLVAHEAALTELLNALKAVYVNCGMDRKTLGLDQTVPSFLKGMAFKLWNESSQEGFDKVALDYIQNFVVNSCESSERHFKENVLGIFQPSVSVTFPKWDLWASDLSE